MHTDPQQPSQFRRRLEEAIGAPRSNIAVVSARPRVSDAAVQGTSCLTVLAASVHDTTGADLQPPFVLVDGRPIQEGWLLWRAHRGLLFLPELRDFFQNLVPPRHSLSFTGAPDLGVHMQVQPGHVVIIDYVQRPPPPLRTAGCGGDVPETGHFPTHVSATGDDAASPSGPPVPSPAGLRPPAGLADSSAVPLATELSDGADIQAVFLVFAPGYLPELLEMRLPAPTSLPFALAAVAAARSPASVRRFPRLLDVRPQPDMAYGTLLALPAWAPAEALVYFDLRGFDDRYVALNVSTAMTGEALLIVAGVPATAHAVVYVRDMPWPLGPAARVELADGDLVVIARLDHRLIVHASLQDMLRSSQGWVQDIDIPGEYGDRTWLVTDHDPVRYDIDRRRAATFRSDVAAALDVSSATLLLQPVWPHVLDFADHGLLIRSVLLAVEPPALTADGPERWIVCLLDLRPILLGFVAAYAPDGLYQVDDLIRRLRPFCPTGFGVVVTGGHNRSGSRSCDRVVFAGEVLTVAFEAAADNAQPVPLLPASPPHSFDVGRGVGPGPCSPTTAPASPAPSDGAPSGGPPSGAGGSSGRDGAAPAMPAAASARGACRRALHHSFPFGRPVFILCAALLCQPLKAVQLPRPLTSVGSNVLPPAPPSALGSSLSSGSAVVSHVPKLRCGSGPYQSRYPALTHAVPGRQGSPCGRLCVAPGSPGYSARRMCGADRRVGVPCRDALGHTHSTPECTG